MLDTIKFIGWSGRHICQQLLNKQIHGAEGADLLDLGTVNHAPHLVIYDLEKNRCPQYECTFKSFPKYMQGMIREV